MFKYAILHTSVSTLFKCSSMQSLVKIFHVVREKGRERETYDIHVLGWVLVYKFDTSLASVNSNGTHSGQKRKFVCLRYIQYVQKETQTIHNN